MRILKNTQLPADVLLRQGVATRRTKKNLWNPWEQPSSKTAAGRKVTEWPLQPQVIPRTLSQHKLCHLPQEPIHIPLEGEGFGIRHGRGWESQCPSLHTVPSCAGSGQAPCLTSLPAATAAKARNFPLLQLNWFSKNKLSSTFTQSE